jgi:hypothetical protein
MTIVRLIEARFNLDIFGPEITTKVQLNPLLLAQENAEPISLLL